MSTRYYSIIRSVFDHFQTELNAIDIGNNNVQTGSFVYGYLDEDTDELKLKSDFSGTSTTQKFFPLITFEEGSQTGSPFEIGSIGTKNDFSFLMTVYGETVPELMNAIDAVLNILETTEIILYDYTDIDNRVKTGRLSVTASRSFPNKTASRRPTEILFSVTDK